MNSIEKVRADDLALALFDEILTPLAATPAGKQRTHRFFGEWQTADSCFQPIPPAPSTAEAFAFPGDGEIEGLIDELAAQWAANGDADLAALKPRLLDIAHALAEENAETGEEVDIFCYTMF